MSKHSILLLGLIALLLVGCAKTPDKQVSDVQTPDTQTVENVATTTQGDSMTVTVTVPQREAEVTVAEVKSALEKGEDIIVLDVRTQSEYEAARVKETFALIPYDEILDQQDKLPANKDSYIYIICRSGRRSGIATATLRNLGYNHSYNVIGGMNAWSAAGYDIASGE